MKKKNDPQIIKFIFIVVSVLELVSHFYDLKELNKYTKPLLIPVLMVYFKRGMTNPLNASFMIATCALIFSWIGDVFLMYQNLDSIYFLIGLSAFAVTQILYMFSFSKARYENKTTLSKGNQIAYTIPFLIIGAVLLWKLIPVAGALSIPLIVYALLLLGMTICAIFRMEQTNQASFNQLFFGAVLFLLSDSLLALNKFLTPMENAGLFIMLTYILAQWNIVNGLLKHYNEK